MSTKSSLALAAHGKTVMHLYREMHDDAVHLEIELEPTNVMLNLVIPPPLVPGVEAILTRAGERTEES